MRNPLIAAFPGGPIGRRAKERGVSEQGIDALIGRYLDDPQFRADFARDPEGTVRREGLELSADELTALHAADGVRMGEALRARISRAAFGLGSS